MSMAIGFLNAFWISVLVIALKMTRRARSSEMPGDRLALAVQVGRQVDVLAGLGQLLELVDDLVAALEDLVLGDKRLEVDAHALAGQVAHVPHRRLHDEAVAEVLVDRLRLGGRFDDHQGLSEGLSVGLGHPYSSRPSSLRRRRNVGAIDRATGTLDDSPVRRGGS